ncbi:unnamed protein product [Prorocentrum cordatum]|uniref:Cyclin N-terminal domain-containing protein n=1 Tax=Prorocentrum cordatum TaxID=2364126 RepID=A0ABN9R5S6_9DINO|nr:unnamed protein product [Polarella glacialis]
MGHSSLGPRGSALVETRTGPMLHLQLRGGGVQAGAALAERAKEPSHPAPVRGSAAEPLRCAGPSRAEPAQERRHLAPLAEEERLECAFDQLGASTELLESWQLIERKLRHARGGSGFQLGPAERRATLRFIYCFIELMDMPPQQTWFEAAALLDAFLRCAPGGTSIGSLPAVAVAVVKVLKKKDMACLDMSKSGLSGHARPLAAALRQLGHAVPDATEGSIAEAEHLLLKTLGWRTCMPSVQAWTEKFCARLSALTRGLPVGPTLEWIWQRSYCQAMALVMDAAEQPPRQVALGLLALGAVEAGLIPLDSVRPGKHEPETWAQLAARRLLAGGAPASPGPPEAVRQVLRLVEKATVAGREEVQDACELVLLTLDRATSAVSTPTHATATGPGATASATSTTGVPMCAAAA